MTDSSRYALEDEIRAGYLTLCGAIVGISGKAVLESGQIKTFKYINGLNLRLARAVIGAADPLMRSIVNRGQVVSTLIISPPGCGKTTLLRDICRQVSDQGFNTVVIDERSEIAASRNSPTGCGRNSYVIDGCPKAEESRSPLGDWHLK